MLSVRKAADEYCEGVILSKSMELPFRAAPRHRACISP